MPGFTSECQSGAHQACVNTDCRCACHPWTRAITEAPQPKNGHPPKRGKKGTAVPPTISAGGELKEAKCPVCSTKALASDNFCRRDGAKLLTGQTCLRCASQGESDDVYCFACGWKHGEPVPAPPPPLTREQQIERLKRMAEERGIDPTRVDALLTETIV